MSTKPRKVNLPSKGMEEATKEAQASFASGQSNSEKSNSSKPSTKPTKDVPPMNKESGTLTDDLQKLQEGIAKYTGVKEQGMSVWAVDAVKKRLDELKFRTGNKVGYRAFTNAALEFVLDKYGDEIVKAFTQD